MAWPTDDIILDNVDQGTDNPSLARSDIYTVFNRVKDVLANRGVADGIADLDANGKLPMARLQTNVANGVAGLDGAGKVGLLQLPTGAGAGLDADLLDGQHGSYYAPLASPAFTGTPTVPTAAAGTNTDQVASTAFVQQEVAGFNPVGVKEMRWAYSTTNVTLSSLVTVLTRSITLDSSSNIVLVQAFGYWNSQSTSTQQYLSLYRGSTFLTSVACGENAGRGGGALCYLDSPGVAGSVTYYLKAQSLTYASTLDERALIVQEYQP